ncbi:GNAT family N-acetyltransferase [uncultured Tateyamaria sp.]|uniref:GNAT family N-acetyltransferase n=1 Tax=uncultured Tateyamaria sp. TaxID=455651 RepID=UPI00263847AD|nr:GNAT family N-acetyltransferase [uncultured Tateyamaria sp.]
MATDTVIRGAEAADHAQWRTLFEGYNAFYGRSGETALSDDVVLTSWHRFLAADEPTHCLVAEKGERLVGLAHFVFHRNTITIENTCYLQDLFTAPDVRGQGIGKLLITAFMEQAERSGTRGVYWHTHQSNSAAMRLYDEVADNTGFVVYRRTLGGTKD